MLSAWLCFIEANVTTRLNKAPINIIISKFKYPFLSFTHSEKIRVNMFDYQWNIPLTLGGS